MKNVWDYDLPKDWKPQSDGAWEWYLVRKLNHGDYEGITKEIVKKYFHRIKRHLDPGIQALIMNYFTYTKHGTEQSTKTGA